jgi:hypothetical protein
VLTFDESCRYAVVLGEDDLNHAVTFKRDAAFRYGNFKDLHDVAKMEHQMAKGNFVYDCTVEAGHASNIKGRVSRSLDDEVTCMACLVVRGRAQRAPVT